jgi:uncharacterized protein YbgA (DUF1722 family)
MGVPRESVRLVSATHGTRMISERSGTDWTASMTSWAAQKLEALKAAELSGYILKKNSPSCGMERVRIYESRGMPSRRGRGLFAAALMAELPLLPVEEEGRMNDPALRENFIERVFGYYRWQRLAAETKSSRALVDFHSRHKFLLLAHSERHYRKLGRLVAEAKKSRVADLYPVYARIFMECLTVPAATGRHANVLEHAAGYFSRQLSKDERLELVSVIQDFRRRLIPLIVPLTLVRHYVMKYKISYLADQIYLDPSPKELMLRNHV